MSAATESFPPPDEPRTFESLCLDLWQEIWGDPGAQKNGRIGQPQAGVDVFGRRGRKLEGVQCKQKSGLLRMRVTVAELNREVEAARNFEPKLSRFILVTTGPADAKVQQRARELTEEHEQFIAQTLGEPLRKAQFLAPHRIGGEEPHEDVPTVMIRELEICGLLVRASTNGPDSLYMFYHRTLYEYLVACELAARVRSEGWDSVAGFLSRKAWSPVWEQVIVLVAGTLDDPLPLLHMLAEQGPTPTNSLGDDRDRHRLMLAMQCPPEVQSTSAAAIQSRREITDAFCSFASGQVDAPQVRRCWPTFAVLRPDRVLSLVRSLVEPPRCYYRRTQMTHDEYLRAFGGGLDDGERDSRAQVAHHVSEMVSDEGTSEHALRVLSALGVHLGRCDGVKRELQHLAHAAVTLLRSSRDDSPVRQSFDDLWALYAPCVDDWRELRAKPRGQAAER